MSCSPTCDDSPRGQRDRALLLFGLASGGRRRSEIAGATMENLRKVGSHGYLYTLGHSKTNQDGKVNPNDDKPIAGIAAAALEAWLDASGIAEGPIFRRILKGGRVLDEGLDPTAIRKIVMQRCLQAGLAGDFSAHSLRSGFVTEAGRRKMDTADAMAMTGHRNYETFMGYYRAEDPLNRRLAGCSMTKIQLRAPERRKAAAFWATHRSGRFCTPARNMSATL